MNLKLNNYKRNEKILLFAIIFVLIGLLLIPATWCIEGASNTSLETEMDSYINEQLAQLNFEGLDEILSEMNQSGQDLFGTTSFWDKIIRVINGDFGVDFNNFLSAIISIFFSELFNFIPLLAIIVAVTVLCSLISNFKTSENGESVHRLIEFVCFGVVVLLVFASVIGLLQSTSSVILSIKTQMDIIFPILLTLLASVGGVVSVGIFQPAIAIMSNLTISIFNYLLLPLFIFTFLFIIVGHLSNTIKLDKFIHFFNSLFKWLAGICFSVFLGVIMLQGIVAGSFDSVSIRATKFALKSYVPILGGYLSDGFNVVAASSVLIKNVVGFAGLLMLFGSIIYPVISVIVFSLGIKLCSAVLEPLTNSKVSDFLSAVSKLMNMLVVILLGVAFMYFVSVGLILCTANIGIG